MPEGAAVIPSRALPGLPVGQARAIVTAPEDRLLAVCAPVANAGDAALLPLIADMFATMYAAPGRGLAGPQIGVMQRLFVMDAGWKTGAPDPVAVLNPVITPLTDDANWGEEGCLSMPGQPMLVRRPAAVRLTGTDHLGRPLSLTLDGAAARIAQHEADHLDGILLGDPRREGRTP